ncbi:MAG: 3-dehydroquinate synthase [Myxococcales bacterium]
MKIVQVSLGERSYPVRIERGRPWRAAKAIADRFAEGAVAVISDGTVAPLYAEPLTRCLRELGMSPRLRVIAPGERSKSMAQAEELIGWLIDTGHGRRRPVVALGGGVVGDLAGFVASIYLRGVPLVMVPTSLLAMVDSSVGGKTGVNHEAGKNQIGTFHQPSLVHVPLGALRSLADRDLSCGLAEVIKYGVIAEPSLLESISRDEAAILDRCPDVIEPIVTLCCRVKAGIVAADETEAGVREVLNFGHTVGHGIEAATGYTELNHGEAVGLGMVVAARVSRRLGMCGPEVEDAITDALEGCRLLTDPAPYRDAPWASAMRHDKKARGSDIRFVAVRAIGKVETVSLSMASLLRLAGEAFLG